MAGQLVHFEIPESDTERGRAFWGGLFGWEFREAFEGVDYHVAQISEGVGSAMAKVEGGARGARAYFDVDDIDAGGARVRELGGEAGERMPVPGMGWYVHCSDPHGNAFGLWQSDPEASM